jgi:hypothetical protein
MPNSIVTRHCGEPLLLWMDFFVTPPTEIGKIISAETNVQLTKPHPSPIFNCTVLAIASVIAAIMGDFLFSASQEPQTRAIVGSLFASLFAYIGCIFYPIFPCCSYVGENGIAEFKQFGSSPQKAKQFILIFQDITDLFHKQIISFYIGVYSGTSFTYTWKNVDRQLKLYSGYYYALHKPPRARSNWHFYRSAELAWTEHLWVKAEKSLQKLGYVEFKIYPRKNALWGVRIGEGWVDFLFKGDRSQRFEITEMKEISIDNGMIHFTYQDAKWHSSNGGISLSYSRLSNASFFFICMERIAYKNFVGMN